MKLVLVNNDQEKEVKVIMSLKIDNKLYYLYEYNNQALYLGRKEKDMMYHLSDNEYEVLSKIVSKMNVVGEKDE